jgi:hypothetical protein
MTKDRVVSFLPFHIDVFILFFDDRNMEVQVFCSMMLCSLVNNYRCLEGTVIFQNVGNFSPVYIV